MKKILLSVFVVMTFIAYSFQQRHDGSAALVAPVATSQTNTSASSANSSQSSGSSPNPSSSSTTQATSPKPTTTSSTKAYKDGQYTGNAADAFYGFIQVKAIISGGKITDVQFLQYPNDRQNSIYINSQADPWLKQEAIQAQSAHVNIISGATLSSNAFIESLTNALNQAV